MFELKQDLERHGVAIESYLRTSKKEDELFRDFAAQRKTGEAALLGRQVAASPRRQPEAKRNHS